MTSVYKIIITVIIRGTSQTKTWTKVKATDGVHLQECTLFEVNAREEVWTLLLSEQSVRNSYVLRDSALFV